MNSILLYLPSGKNWKFIAKTGKREMQIGIKSQLFAKPRSLFSNPSRKCLT